MVDIQLLGVIVLFIAAIFYISRLVYKSLKAKKACSTGCKKCGVDFSEIEVKS